MEQQNFPPALPPMTPEQTAAIAALQKEIADGTLAFANAMSRHATFGARSGGKSYQASNYKFSDETEAQYQDRMRKFKLDMLAHELGRGQARIKALQAIFKPRKMAILVAQAHGLPLLPGLLVRYDGLGKKVTFPVSLSV